jgi:hypothetical protein
MLEFLNWPNGMENMKFDPFPTIDFTLISPPRA